MFLLYSDGVSDPLDDDAIARVAESSPFEMLADALVTAALDKGGEDNVTVVAVQAT